MANEPRTKEMTYKNHRVTLREDEDDCDLRIDGVPIKIARLAPESYHSHIFTHQEFSSAEELAKALIDTEGTLWALPGEDEPHGPHSHDR